MNDDLDQDDWDAIEEVQILQRHSRLEEGAYRRFGEEGYKRNLLNMKKKQLHKHLWAKQRYEINAEHFSKQESELGDANVFRGEGALFTTMIDPTGRRDVHCVARCQTQYSCGTQSAPEYRGVLQIVRPA
ncbi:hypothetical protein BGZ54_000510 [Gamsiella multidivaricata]|nr:hypothetical protein BGZ54_000510 [Gamsiella multidivaricata]